MFFPKNPNTLHIAFYGLEVAYQDALDLLLKFLNHECKSRCEDHELVVEDLIIRQPRFIKRLCLVPPKWFLKLASTFFFKGHGWKKLLLQPIPHTLNHNLHRHLFTSRSPTRMNNGCIDPTRLFTTLLVFEFHWKLGAYGSKQYRSPTCLLWQQIGGDCSTKRPSSNINSE